MRIGRRRRAVAVLAGLGGPASAVLIGSSSKTDPSAVVAATVNLAHTVPDGASYLVVGIHAFGVPIDISGVTFDGQSMTVIKSAIFTSRSTAVCYLANPNATTANIVMSFTGSIGGGVGAIAQCFVTASPGAHEDTDVDSGNPTTSVSVVLTSPGASRLNVSVLMGATAITSATPGGTGHTKIDQVNITSFDESIALGWQPVGAGDTALSWSVAPSQAWGLRAATLP